MGALGWPCNSQAAALQISPVMVTLNANTNAGVLTLRNDSDQPLYGQVRVFSWWQNLEADQLTPSDDLVASPPLIRIDAGASQLVRVIKRRRFADGREHAYRLLIDELPLPGQQTNAGIVIRLRYSVPVFLAPASAAKPALAWHVRQHDGRWYLCALNTGQQHAQIGAATLSMPNGRFYSITGGLLGYALAGEAREWPLPLPSTTQLGSTLVLHATVNALPSDSTIPVAQVP